MKVKLEKYLAAQRELVMELDDDVDVDIEKELAACGRMGKLCLQASVSAAQRTEEEEQSEIELKRKSPVAELEINKVQ